MGGLEVECARRIAELERRRAFERDGHLSMAAWLDSRFRAGWSAAAKEVRLARGLEAMPATRAALSDGELSGAAAATLVAAREANAEEFSRVEEALLEAARSLPAPGLRRAVEHWKEVVGPEVAARDEPERFDRRGLYISPLMDGMVRVDGNLDPETGQTLITAIGSVTDAWAHSGQEDPRSPAQRRADAIGEVCRHWLDHSDRPTVAGERPHVTVTLDLESLERRVGRRCELDDAGRVSPGDGEAPGLRRLDHPRHHEGIVRAARRRQEDPGDLGRASPGSGGAGPRLPVPRV